MTICCFLGFTQDLHEIIIKPQPLTWSIASIIRARIN
jgi:hypothetical protein